MIFRRKKKALPNLIWPNLSQLTFFSHGKLSYGKNMSHLGGPRHRRGHQGLGGDHHVPGWGRTARGGDCLPVLPVQVPGEQKRK